jgi:hypothetical protein
MSVFVAPFSSIAGPNLPAGRCDESRQARLSCSLRSCWSPSSPDSRTRQGADPLPISRCPHPHRRCHALFRQSRTPRGSFHLSSGDHRRTGADERGAPIVPRRLNGVLGATVWARHLPLHDRVLSLVRCDGPVQLRIGGDSADHVFWSPVRALPEWVFELTPGWLNEVSSIVRRSHVRLILDLNLVTASLRNATRWASTAVAKLPHGNIPGVRNRQRTDINSQTFWRSTSLGGLGSRVLPRQITADSYVTAFAAYARALARVSLGVPLMGPALAEPGLHIGWVSTLLASPHPGLCAVTAHRYPLSACSQSGTQTYPTIRRVPSEAATAGMPQTVRPAVRLAARAALPVRLTELNSVTCGGTRGVSNTFATAPWAPDALFELVHAGVASADVHVRANAINAAFTLNRHGLVAHPLLYGMILFARMLGPHPQLVGLRLQNLHRFHLKAWAVRTQGKVIHVLLIDKGQHSVRVGLRLPATGPATVQRLHAPSVSGTSGIDIGRAAT